MIKSKIIRIKKKKIPANGFNIFMKKRIIGITHIEQKKSRKIKGFYIPANAYFANNLKDSDKQSVHFGVYDSRGGCLGEMEMRWEKLTQNVYTPRLICYDDAFKQLIEIIDIFKSLSRKSNFTQEYFVKVLLKNGFVDRTKYFPE